MTSLPISLTTYIEIIKLVVGGWENETYKMVAASQLNCLTCMLARMAEQERHRLMVQPSIKESTGINLIIE